MSATLIAVVLALFLGHAMTPLARLRRHGWFDRWLAFGRSRFGHAFTSPLSLLISLGLPLLLVGWLQSALDGRFFGIPGFLFAMAVLIYCWGPRDLDLDVETVIDEREPDARLKAAAALFPVGGKPALEGPALVEAVFRSALWRWFGVLFWFALLGAAGALGYRLAAIAAQDEAGRQADGDAPRRMRTLLAALDWPVAQLMTFGLALAADFDRVVMAWRQWHAEGWRLDAGFLAAAGRASVASELAEEEADPGDGPAQAPDLLELRDAMSLVWRVLLLWLGVIALFVLAGFVG